MAEVEFANGRKTSALLIGLAEASRGIAEWLGVAPQVVSSGLGLILLCFIILAALPIIKRFSGSKEQGAQVVSLAVYIIGYSLCSSTLLILNKVAVTYVPSPSFILFAQLLTTALFIKGMATAKVLESEDLEWEKSKSFGVIVFGFIGVLWSNVSALRYVPVDTLICFRASSPLVICIIEYLYLGRDLPSLRSWLSLLGVFFGVLVYTAADINFSTMGYIMITIWYGFAVFEMIFVKKVVDTIQMTTWARAYYQNALSVLPCLVFGASMGELNFLFSTPPTATGWIMVLLSCVGGLGMSYTSFALRAKISATSFAVIGNICKTLTIVINVMLWDNHSNGVGMAALFLCLIMGALYQQAPMRKTAHMPVKQVPV